MVDVAFHLKLLVLGVAILVQVEPVIVSQGPSSGIRIVGAVSEMHSLVANLKPRRYLKTWRKGE